jgi:hypothetical protein|tara:strand:+ start:78 stop:623 length:546 start_codon:yes stop_codon:yes gene_type:complete
VGIIGKDFKYKIIKNFLSKDEIDLFSLYCEIRHRTNFTEFDFEQNNIGDTYFYGDPIMDSLMLKKQSLMEKETGKKLLATYSFWRTYTKFAILKKHTDRPACEISVTILIGSDKTKWPIYMDGNPLDLERGDAAVYLGCEVEHWREEFEGDHQFQTFLHYVDAEGNNKEHYMDKRKFWGTK